MRKMYFENVDCVEELKKQFLHLCKKHHPDCGGSTSEMQAVNAEYDELFKKYKDIHRNANENTEETTYKSATATCEQSKDFMDILQNLMTLDGIDIELCGRWLWISGDTRANKDSLKAFGCKWSNNKKMWSWHFDKDSIATFRRKRNYGMDTIREKYGSARFEQQVQIG